MELPSDDSEEEEPEAEETSAICAQWNSKSLLQQWRRNVLSIFFGVTVGSEG